MPGTYSLSGRIIHQWLADSGGSGGGGRSSGCEDFASAAGSPLDRVADVQIDEGVFKYVLLRVTDPEGNIKVKF